MHVGATRLYTTSASAISSLSSVTSMRCVAVSMAILLSAAAATSHLSSEHSATDASTQQRPRRIGNWPSDLALDIPPSITHCHHGDVARPDKRTSTSTQSGSQSHRPRRYIPDTVCNAICSSLCYTMKTDAVQNLSFLADRPTVLTVALMLVFRPSVCNLCTCIVAKRCVLRKNCLKKQIGNGL